MSSGFVYSFAMVILLVVTLSATYVAYRLMKKP